MPMLSCPVQIPLVDRETNGNFLRKKAKLSAFRRHKKKKKTILVSEDLVTFSAVKSLLRFVRYASRLLCSGFDRVC